MIIVSFPFILLNCIKDEVNVFIYFSETKIQTLFNHSTMGKGKIIVIHVRVSGIST